MTTKRYTGFNRVQRPVAPRGPLTSRVLLELADHEGIVLEAYKDVKGIWTWGIGVTSRSGHHVNRYVDNPSTIEHVMAIYEWLLRTRYLPAVLRAFEGYTLTENQLAAALSFHYNTGGINRAAWVRLYKQGRIAEARNAFMSWSRPRSIIPRRKAERDLFFDGRWSSDGLVPIYQVSKPRYIPVRPRVMDIRPHIERALRGG